MSMAWRFLFETLQFQILAPHTLGRKEAAFGLTSEESVELAALGLVQAAKVLAAAETVGHPDREVMWRFWADLKPEPTVRGEAQTPISGLHPKLTIAIFAQLLSRAARFLRTQDQEARRDQALSDLQARVSDLPHEREFATEVASLMDSASTEAAWASRLWDELSRDQIPERQVVVVESLSTAVLRLIAFYMFARGPIRSYLGDWMRNVQRTHFQELVSEVSAVAESSHIRFAASAAEVLAAFDDIKPQAERRFAEDMTQAPIDPERLASLRNAFELKWKSDHRLVEMIEAASGTVVDDEDPIESSSTTISRAFLVANTNYVGEKWTGEGIAENTLHFEIVATMQHWMTGVDVEDDVPFVLGLAEIAAEWGQAAVFRAIDYSGDVWLERHADDIAEFQPHLYTTTVMPDDLILVVDASEQTWHISSRSEPVEISTHDLALRPDEEAKVELRYSYARPRPVGQARVRMFKTPW